jgi:riboflavin transporter FmnP
MKTKKQEVEVTAEPTTAVEETRNNDVVKTETVEAEVVTEEVKETEVVDEDQKAKCKKEDKKCRRKKTISFIARAAIFSAIATLFYIIPVPPFNFPIFPGAFSFLKVHIDEVPILIATFAYGPVMGVIVLLVKTLIKLPMSNTGFLGELGDVVYSLGFILPAAFVYKQNRKFSGAVLALIVGVISQVATSTIYNFYLQYDLYNNLFGGELPFTKDEFISISIPFNLIKDAIVIAITLPTYKSVHKLIDKV